MITNIQVYLSHFQNRDPAAEPPTRNISGKEDSHNDSENPQDRDINNPTETTDAPNKAVTSDDNHGSHGNNNNDGDVERVTDERTSEVETDISPKSDTRYSKNDSRQSFPYDSHSSNSSYNNSHNEEETPRNSHFPEDVFTDDSLSEDEDPLDKSIVDAMNSTPTHSKHKHNKSNKPQNDSFNTCTPSNTRDLPSNTRDLQQQNGHAPKSSASNENEGSKQDNEKISSLVLGLAAEDQKYSLDDISFEGNCRYLDENDRSVDDNIRLNSRQSYDRLPKIILTNSTETMLLQRSLKAPKNLANKPSGRAMSLSMMTESRSNDADMRQKSFSFSSKPTRKNSAPLTDFEIDAEMRKTAHEHWSVMLKNPGEWFYCWHPLTTISKRSKTSK